MVNIGQAVDLNSGGGGNPSKARRYFLWHCKTPERGVEECNFQVFPSKRSQVTRRMKANVIIYGLLKQALTSKPAQDTSVFLSLPTLLDAVLLQPATEATEYQSLLVEFTHL